MNHESYLCGKLLQSSPFLLVSSHGVLRELSSCRYSDSPAEEPGASGSAKPPGSDPNPLAKVELDLLAKLMGQVEVGEDVCAVGGMRLSVFPEEKEETKE